MSNILNSLKSSLLMIKIVCGIAVGIIAFG
jgi:hypothetical protein